MSSLFDLPFEDDPPASSPPEAPAARVPEPRAEERRPRAYTVSELTHAVRRTLETDFGRVWVEGEIADCTVSQGNVYFTLKDATAQLSAVLWRTDAARLRFKPITGLHVLVKGRLSVYVPRGRYQLMADSIEPRGAGALQLAFEQLKRRLHAEGLFATARKRALPLLPRRIGVVTSIDGAALRDVLRVLRTRRAPADIVISPTRVQGDGAAGEIARAIARAARVPGVDVLIVGRGGGSLEDLWAFNEEVVARAIAAAPMPVIAAVGHEVDTTIADFVADVRAATPSQAAELVMRGAADFADRLAGAERQMTLQLRGALERRRTRLFRIEQRPGLAHYRDDLRGRERLRAELDDRLTAAWRAADARRRRRLDDATRRIDEQHPQRQLVTRLRRLAQVDERLRTAILARRTGAVARLRLTRERLAACGLDRRVSQARRRVDDHVVRASTALTRTRHAHDRLLSSLAARLDALSPLSTLARGYAICWETPGVDVVRSVTDVAPGDRVHVQLTDGVLRCEVEAAEPGAPSRP